MITLPASHAVFTDNGFNWARVGVPEDAQVDIHFGINAAFQRQLQGDGDVACWCVARGSDGKFPGMANSPGFVLNLDYDALVEAGADADEILISQGCNAADREDDNGPVCSECLSAAGERGRKLRLKGTHVCWSCAQSWHENREAERRDREESEALIDSLENEFASDREVSHD